VDVAYDPRGKDYQAWVERLPVGPVLGIVPYNWPYNLAAHKIAPALAVGCTMVVKPSSAAPLSTLTLCRLIHEAGCPPGVVNAVVCPSKIAERMALDPRIAKVSFTGSPAVGWGLKEKLPRKKVTLELGGDASAIVMPDADLDWATKRIVAGKFGYAGQICISVQHARIHQDVYADMRARLIEATLACKSGDPEDPTTVCGPLVSAEAADKVQAWLQEALDGGGKLLAGGLRDGNVVSPTLIENVPASARLSCEEVFGPVLTLSSFATLDEAIAAVNASNYGIHAGVFTRDPAAAERCFNELEVGGVVVNDYPTLRFDSLPYGGVKNSGFGREGVRYAMDEMTELKSFVKYAPTS
jgi:acyl-CoA reductase-like NAD-dependent aldehyde dehydrogenase